MSSDAFPEQAERLRAIKECAVEALSRREHSACELMEKLVKKGFSDRLLTQQVLHELEQAGYQSDSRFARMLCRSRVESGKGPNRIHAELLEHGIDEQLIAAVLKEYEDRWHDLAQAVWLRKTSNAACKSLAEWSRVARFMQQRGFAMEHIPHFIPPEADNIT